MSHSSLSALTGGDQQISKANRCREASCDAATENCEGDKLDHEDVTVTVRVTMSMVLRR